VQTEGTVVRREGVFAYVRVVRSGGCGRCHEIGGCGGQGHESHVEEFFVDNVFGAGAGQKVCIEIPDGATLKAALLMYGVPLCALLLAAGLAYWIDTSDLVVALGAAVGLLGAMLCLRVTRRMNFVRQSRIRITGIVLP
jgi:sigma-E factor negative regulatory protein RseC